MSEPHPSSHLSLSSKSVLCVLAVLPAIFATGYSSYEFLRQDVLLVAAALVLTIWGVEVIKQRAYKTLALSVLAPLAGLSLWALISAFWSPLLLSGVLDAGLLLSLTALAVPLALPSRDPLSWRHVMAAVSVGTLAAGTCGLLDAAGVGIFSLVWDAAGPAGTFDAPEFGVAYYVIALPLSVALCNAKQTALKVLGALSLVVGCVHLAMLGASWMALGALLVGLAIPAAALMVHSKRLGQTLSPLGLAAAVIVLVAAGIGAAQFGPEDEPYNPATALPVVATHNVLFSPDSVAKGVPRDARFAISRIEAPRDPLAKDYLQNITLKAAKDRPLIGQGAGGWWLNQSRFITLDHEFIKGRFDQYPAFRSTHNGYAKVFIEYGVLGLLLLIATFFAAIAAFSAPLRRDAAPGDVTPDVHALWGFAASLLAGALILISTSAIELAAPMAVLTASLISLAVTAHRVDTAGEVSPAATRSIITPLLAVLVATGLVTMGALELTAGYHQGKADQFMLYGYYEKAAPSYLDAHDILPAHGENLFNAINASWRTGDAEEMIPRLETAIALRPHDARFHHLKGSIHLIRHEFKEAIASEKTAISLFPTYLDAYKTMGLAYDRSMDFKNSTRVLEDTIALNPPTKMRAEMHTTLGSVYNGPLNNIAKAIYHYEKALPLLTHPVAIEHVKVKIVESKKQIERDRLMREGKPVPANLMPQKEHNHIEGMMKPPGLPGADVHDGHNH